MVVVVIIGIIATIALPRLRNKTPGSDLTTVLDEFNNLVYYARQEAISNQKSYRLHFHTSKTGQDTVQVEVEGNDMEKPEKKIWSPVRSAYFNPLYKLPETVTMQGVYLGKVEQLEENQQHAYCYIIAEGLVQEIMIHILKTVEKKQTQVTFQVSPFLGKFELIQGFVKPQK
jgi:Tfp pilus assembly protein FimT